jgi:hypothetical protein
MGTENPREIIQHVSDSAKINVWCGLLHNKVIGPFSSFFTEATVNATIYLDMLEIYTFLQLEEGVEMVSGQTIQAFMQMTLK